MLYQINQGVVVPIIKKYDKFLFLALAGIFIFTQFFALMQFSKAAPGLQYVDLSYNSADWICDRSCPSSPNGVAGNIYDSSTNAAAYATWSSNQVSFGVDPVNTSTNGTFYQTEGIQRAIPSAVSVKTTQTLDSAWASNTGLRSGLWARSASDLAPATESEAAYPILEFTIQSGYTGWRVWNTYTGVWTNVTGPTLPVAGTIDVEMEIVANIDSGNFEFYLQGNKVHEYLKETIHSTLTTVFYNVFNSSNATSTSNTVWSNLKIGNIDPNRYVEDGKIWICHANSAANNRYTSNNVSIEGLNGHGDHDGPYVASEEQAEQMKKDKIDWGDVIPPFGDYSGLNWTAESQVYWEENCDKGEVLGECDEEEAIETTRNNDNDDDEEDDECVEPIEPCTLDVYSDISNTVNEKANANAKALSFIHPAWTASILGATWIWGDNPVADPEVKTIQTFKKTFYWNGPVTDAEIKIAADNDFILYVNGAEVGSDYSGASFASVKTFDIESEINSDELNIIEIEVTNWEWPTKDAQTNPAGLLYKAVVTGTDKDCAEQPEEPDVPTVTLSAQKIVCDDESLLPNAGDRSFSPIGESTAQEWLEEKESCSLAEGWSFEYKTQGDQSNPGGSTVGPKGGDWNTFSADESGTIATKVIPIENVSLIQTREVLPEGYIPFSDNSSDVSAEFYCDNDAGNYDNWEWVDGLQDGATYYCVAWNAPVTTCTEILTSMSINLL